MRTFLNHIKNETLDEIKTSLENLWQQMIQLSEFFQYSFVLILKRKCLVRASRVRSGESGTPSTIIYVRWSSRRYELGCDTPVTLVVLGVRVRPASLGSVDRCRLRSCAACSLWCLVLWGIGICALCLTCITRPIAIVPKEHTIPNFRAMFAFLVLHGVGVNELSSWACSPGCRLACTGYR